MTEDKLKEITTNLRAYLCCGSDLPENDCVFDEIYAAVEEAYNLGKGLTKRKYAFKHSEDDDVYEGEIEAYSYDEAQNKIIEMYDDAWIVNEDDNGALG